MDMPDIDKIMKRTARRAYEDGIGEILYGAMFMLVGLLFFVGAALNPPIPSFGPVGLVVLVLCGHVLGRWLVPGLDWIPLGNGLVIGAFLLYLGVQVGLRRFMLLAGFSGLAGVAAFLAGMGATLGTTAYFAAMGLALSVCGALTLRAYLRGAPRPEEQ